LLCYQAKEKKRITLEAVLLGGINTKKTDAASFADFANGLDVFVNLIPWNYVEGLNFNDAPLCTPGSNEVRRFAADLESFGLKTFIRRKKGRSVGGACGQLGKLFCL
jgi:23S rRNA (adenine2503-C2)-methyltransferase